MCVRAFVQLRLDVTEREPGIKVMCTSVLWATPGAKSKERGVLLPLLLLALPKPVLLLLSLSFHSRFQWRV